MKSPLLLLSLLASAPALAEGPFTELRVHGTGLISTARSFMGPGASLRLGGCTQGTGCFFGVARVSALPYPHMSLTGMELGLGGGWRTGYTEPNGLTMSMGVAAGVAGVLACVHGDMCGGAGLWAGPEWGLGFPLRPGLSGRLAVELLVHGGVYNGINVLFAPNVGLGLQWGG